MFEGLLRFLGRSTKEADLTVEVQQDGLAYIMAGQSVYAGPYKRPADAKGQLTRLRRTYTPASRRPADG